MVKQREGGKPKKGGNKKRNAPSKKKVGNKRTKAHTRKVIKKGNFGGALGNCEFEATLRNFGS